MEYFLVGVGITILLFLLTIFSLVMYLKEGKEKRGLINFIINLTFFIIFVIISLISFYCTQNNTIYGAYISLLLAYNFLNAGSLVDKDALDTCACISLVLIIAGIIFYAISFV